jgi:DNA-binding NtrC family response regulator
MQAQIKPLTFLIVDDDIPLSIFFKETLLRDEHRVFVAVNVHGALDIAKHETIDILLCDLVLPGLDGTQIIKLVKEHNPRTFCVLISGYHNKISTELKLLDNADMVIAKPIFRETLDRIIQQYLLHYPGK